eukprot:3509669-Prymnesium_polylepis.1
MHVRAPTTVRAVLETQRQMGCLPTLSDGLSSHADSHASSHPQDAPGPFETTVIADFDSFIRIDDEDELRYLADVSFLKASSGGSQHVSFLKASSGGSQHFGGTQSSALGAGSPRAHVPNAGASQPGK